MNIEDLTQAVEQAAQVHKFTYENSSKVPYDVKHAAFTVWNDLAHQLIEM